MQRHVGARHDFTLTSELAEGVTELSRARNVTPFMLLLAAFATLLYRLSAQDDVVVGTPIANRTHVELENIVGFFSNTVALRISLAGNPSFSEVIRRTREAALGAYAYQELPFDEVVQALRVPRELSWNPVFQVNFRARTEPAPQLHLSGIDVEPITVDIGFSRFDLSLELHLNGETLGGYFEYDVELFDHATTLGFVESLSALLEQVVADSDVEILTLKLPARRHSPPSLTSGAAGRTIERRRGLGGRTS